jgi:hypothetical protein
MEDYDNAAHESLKKMHEKHELEIIDLREEILGSYHVFTLSKRCCDLRD